jgi:hypothetical protein
MELNIKDYGVFEVDDIFTSLPKNEQEDFINKIKNNIDKDKLDSKDVKPHKLDSKIARAKEFEQSTLGKSLDFASKVISAPARVLGVGESVPFSERLERKKQKEASQEERGLTKQEQIKEDVKEIGRKNIEDTARFAAFALPVGKGAKLAKAGKKKFGKAGEVLGRYASQASQAIGFNAAPRLVEELAKGEDLEASLETAKNAGVGAGAIALALPLVGNVSSQLKKTPMGSGLKKLSEKLATTTKKTVSEIEEYFKSIPKESYLRVLNRELKGENPFKGKFDEKLVFENIGKKANMALKEIQGKAKIRKAKETSILSKVLSKFNLQKNVNRYTKNLNSKRGKQDIYTSTEKEIIGNILNDIKYEDSLAGYGVILDKIDNNLISWNKIEDITIRTKKGQKLLKNIASMLRKKIKEVSEVDEIRSLNKEVAELTEVLGRGLKINKKAKRSLLGSNIKMMYNDNDKYIALQRLDDLAEKNKFFKDLENNFDRQYFEKIAPGLGGGSGGDQGFLNLIRQKMMPSIGVGAGGIFGGVPGAALGLYATSPKIGGKTTVRALGMPSKAVRASKGSSRLGIPLIGQTFADMKSDDQQEEENKPLIRRKIKE